jgi:hypothetical protein
MKLRELKEKVAHKAHHEADLPDVARDDDNAFMHMTSKDTGAAEAAEKRETKGGPKSVY